LSSAATSSVVKGGSDSAPAASPAAGTSSGAISVGGQSDLGQDHSVALLYPPHTDRRGLRPAGRLRDFPHLAPSAAFVAAVREMDRSAKNLDPGRQVVIGGCGRQTPPPPVLARPGPERGPPPRAMLPPLEPRRG
jgi:hypothetical protein